MSMHSQPVAIVTGAGSGIGRATAGALSGAGHAVVLVGRRAGLLEETASAMAAAERMVCAGDLAENGFAERVVEQAVARFGRVDVVVNNAGVGRPVAMADMTIEVVEAVWRVNTRGPAALMLAAWRVFARQRVSAADRPRADACIVNVSSMASFDPFPGFFAYAASKAALDMMTVSAAKEGAAVGGGWGVGLGCGCSRSTRGRWRRRCCGGRSMNGRSPRPTRSTRRWSRV